MMRGAGVMFQCVPLVLGPKYFYFALIFQSRVNDLCIQKKIILAFHRIQIFFFTYVYHSMDIILRIARSDAELKV